MYLTAKMCSLQCYSLDTYEAEAMVPCTAEEALSALDALCTAARKIIKEADDELGEKYEESSGVS